MRVHVPHVRVHVLHMSFSSLFPQSKNVWVTGDPDLTSGDPRDHEGEEAVTDDRWMVDLLLDPPSKPLETGLQTTFLWSWSCHGLGSFGLAITRTG